MFWDGMQGQHVAHIVWSKASAMRQTRQLAFTAIAALSLAAAGPAAHAASLLTNGDFEAAGGSLNGWTATTAGAGDVSALTAADYVPCCGVTGSEPAFSGNHFASYDSGNVTGTATLTQGFSTLAGHTYTLNFDLGAFGGGTNTVDVTVQGVTHSFTVSANNNADTTLHPETISFTGLGGAQAVAFSVTTGPDNTDALLDNVTLNTVVSTAVPEPGIWALMIAGFGAAGAALRRRRASVAGQPA